MFKKESSSSLFQNPSKPHFNHYLFESLCLSIRITCKANPATVGSFEEALFPVFTEILQNDVQGEPPIPGKTTPPPSGEQRA